MTIHMRQYAGLRDIQPFIDIQGVYTTAENMYDNPTVSYWVSTDRLHLAIILRAP